jgi:hypothetical protein
MIVRIVPNTLGVAKVVIQLMSAMITILPRGRDAARGSFPASLSPSLLGSFALHGGRLSALTTLRDHRGVGSLPAG